ncbi:two-component sensor histidine kinase [Sphingomonas sp. PP-F2F-A104-K0414]|uniref:GAF domain-containing protein n=1 Tax=Sphingomonas sp. PP-F2F-A104-K0414 TaxID=2135661 RepID=UPI00104BAA00|nr:GAF domain-containing protein [Sphingomonas sp. PP-F2F-A104-K0414]TCP97484.1 two-component sensor histidine kinase [Sphingomonas sp. PP-F2F-A104-K0414]
MTNAEAISHYEVLDTGPEISFDDIVALAAQVCETPTALVSLLDGDRQWFKARIGFEPCETDIDSSVCRHVVAARSLIVIPDLTNDERTVSNPLVVADDGIRFYAGAPLATRFGVVGSLCVIDTSPRPAGLTADQEAALLRLSRQVVTLLEMRRDTLDLQAALAARDASRKAQAISERRWQDLYQKMDTGFIYARVIRNADGKVCDWRYEEVNDAWGNLVGINPADARGRTIRELIPNIEDEWVLALARVVETQEPYHFTSQVGVFERWYDGTAQSLGGDDFTVIFHEVTARIKGVRRSEALLALGDVLRDRIDSDGMIVEASRIIGEAVGASRATFGEMDHTREIVSVEAGWSVAGMPSIEGEHRFSDYGELRAALLAGDVVVIDDTSTDRRTAADFAAWTSLRTHAVVIVPVRERDRTVAVLLIHKDSPYHWTDDEVGFLRSAADRLETANARRRDDEQQGLVNGEIAHRLKNALSMVQAVATQTLRGDASPEGLEAFTRRLQALGHGHDALTSGRWKAATLNDILGGVLDGAAIRDRCTIQGPSVEMGARAALSTSLLIHELATNAVKYGALCAASGHVDITWQIEGDGDECQLALDWAERGGPAVTAPTRKGFGSKLIRLGLVGTGGSDIRYEKEGLRAAFTARLAEVEQA